MGLVGLLIVFVLSVAVGYKLLSEVPVLLHTPLMSGMNALSGITLLSALVATAAATALGLRWLGVLAVLFATVNVVGGFLVTDRMLRMFRSDRAGPPSKTASMPTTEAETRL